MKKLIAALTLALLANAGLALEVQGTQLDDTAKVGGSDLLLNGAGVRSAGLGREVYVAGLYLREKSQSAEKTIASKQPKRVTLVFHRDMKGAVLHAAFRDGISLNATGADMDKLGTEIGKLEQAMAKIPEVKGGDRLLLDVMADGSLALTYNGQSQGTVAGPDIGPAMLKIWLGDVPVSDDLKNAMLAGAHYGPKALMRKSAFDSLYDGMSP